MNAINEIAANNAANTYPTPQTNKTQNTAKSNAAAQAYAAAGGVTKSANYGATIGKPELSEAGAKYYEELKKKFGKMDFVLVSKDMIDVAKNQASSYGKKTAWCV